MALEALDLGPLGAEDVEVAVEHCGLCHSALSVFNNDWGISQYPAILDHEGVGWVTTVGPYAKGHQVGQRVGVGWFSASDMHCRQCMSGNHHLCPQTITCGVRSTRHRRRVQVDRFVPVFLVRGDAGTLIRFAGSGQNFEGPVLTLAGLATGLRGGPVASLAPYHPVS
jgi:threonine dehydrogenase-like Zn-dependent dehydrogenase